MSLRELPVVPASTAEEKQREQQRRIGIASLPEDVLDEQDRITQTTMRCE